MANRRAYEQSHPWITFQFNMAHTHAFTWMALGEIQSKCEHLAGVPLDPAVARKMHLLYLAKGVMATTAIEGNTLSVKEVEQRISGELKLPPSKEYLGREIDNILDATNSIFDRVMNDSNQTLTAQDVKSYNSTVLAGLDVDKDVIPGMVRGHSVTVGRYRGAPAEDCDYLLDRLCNWLSGPDFTPKKGYEIVYGVIKAIIGHIYLAWIHPFGDGNGRTARLLEVRFLLEAGAPTPAAHLLSNFYNQTRNAYYKNLDEVSKNGGDIMPFITYAADGLCGQLREQISTVRSYQFAVTWENYVHSMFKDRKTETDYRRRHLILAISQNEKSIPWNSLRRLSPEIAELYAGRTVKTVARDVNALVDMGLLEKAGRMINAKTDVIRAFLPDRLDAREITPQVDIHRDAA